ncbi:hypothetical protein QTP88_009080 [Uroleucon formosanum]
MRENDRRSPLPEPPATDWALEPHPPETAEDETVEDFTLAEFAQACKRLPLGEAAATLLNPVLAKASAWMKQNGLKLAPTKTEAVVLTRKNKYDNPELLVEGHIIPIKQSMRYLGVEIDTRLSFTKHIQQASRKATDSATAIARLMPNIGGPSQSKRALLGTVANSKMLYASPTWAVRGTKTAKNRAELARAQRTVALRITLAYRTVSGDASSVLASMLPADLLAT